MNEVIANKFLTYKFVSDFAVIYFAVGGMENWTEEMFDDAAQQELESLVQDPSGFYVDDVYEMELP